MNWEFDKALTKLGECGNRNLLGIESESFSSL